MGILIRFVIGGLMYMGMEVLFDNTSDRSMGLVGGLLFVLCGSCDEWLQIPFILNCFLIATIIVLGEYIVGMIVNKDYQIWDYRKIPFNLNGQICLRFWLIWLIVIAPIIIIFDNALRTIT